MTYNISGARVFRDGKFKMSNIAVEGDRVISVSDYAPVISGGNVFKFDGAYVFPGFADVHVHLREPGFSAKETVKSGTMAASRGGFTAVCAMPNLDPVPDSAENLAVEREIIARDAAVRVYPYGALTVGEKGKEIADLEGMARDVIAFSDDGKGVQDPAMMREAMLRCKALGKPVVAHCEDESLLNGGYIHLGGYCERNGHRGICSESEWKMIERDLDLVSQTGCSYHVCHVSTKEGAELIRQAKKSGLDVSGETAPHYLLLCDEDLIDDGRFKMNPPIRDASDREALIEAVLDGTLEVIATDHAPHTAQEKSRGLAGSLNGIVGLETAFPVLYTGLVRRGIMPLETLIDRMSASPSRRFGLGIELAAGSKANFNVFDLDSKYNVDPNEFLSMGRATPFEGMEVYGKCLMTAVEGEIVYRG